MRISDWSSDVCSSDLARIVNPRTDDDPNPNGAERRPDRGTARPARRPRLDGGGGARASRPWRGLLSRHAARRRLLSRDDRGGRVNRRALRPRSRAGRPLRHKSEEHTSELQSLMRISYAVFCLKKKKQKKLHKHNI